MTALQILYSDDEVVVIDKPTSLLSVPGRTSDKQDCVLQRLEQIGLNVLVVHRLDRDTSGVLLFARNSTAQSKLNRAFAERRVLKRYEAFVTGTVSDPEGRVDLPLRKDMKSQLPPRYVVDHDHGKPAQTDWKIVGNVEGDSRLSLRPLTGRSHQLRVHCQSIGHPIVGDPIYGTKQADRLMLHAVELTFPHPTDDAILTVRSECPF